jgi:hypothetical protein
MSERDDGMAESVMSIVSSVSRSDETEQSINPTTIRKSVRIVPRHSDVRRSRGGLEGIRARHSSVNKTWII